MAESHGSEDATRCRKVSVRPATACRSAVFFNEKVRALSCRARNKSVTEDTCSWVVNYNGNVNNNNRNNSNDVRAVSEFQREMNDLPEHTAISYDSLLDAYMQCRRNKAWKDSAAGFEIHYERELLRLRDEINGGAYRPRPSITFLVQWPTLREVFAADFRDRIVQTWIAMRIEPLFEAQFIPASFNCRKGKGTLAAVKYLHEVIREKSENYTRDCWVLKYDLKGFFMSIDRQTVTDKLCAFIRERYKGDDFDTLIALTQITLLNSPSEGCIMQGNPEAWKGLAPNKSLFTVPEGHGLPIGNITSQLVANFLLDEADHYLTETLGLKIDRYVDDTAIVDTDKERMLMVMPVIREYLRQSAGVTVNPKKYYLQHYTKGVKFLGTVIKGERIYLANRTLGKAMCMLHGYNRMAQKYGADHCKRHAERFVASVNSYLGLMRQCREYGMRRAFCNAIAPEWLKYVAVEWDFTKIILKQKYKRRERIKRMLRRKRNKASRIKQQKAKRMTARVFGDTTLPAVEQFNTGRKRGCIVRWDFEPVKTTIPSVDKRANFRKRQAAVKAAKAGKPLPQEQEMPQGELVDSGLVAYSEMRYLGKPDPEKVVSDILADLDLRYGEAPRPEIDIEYYRSAIAALPNG